jgi:hypothetical protein
LAQNGIRVPETVNNRKREAKAAEKGTQSVTSSKHGKHATKKCPYERCEYAGRSDKLKEHITTKHK